MSRRSRFAAFVAVLLVVAAPALAAGTNEVKSPDTITFHEDVEPILQRSCQGCHRPEGVAYGGMKAPMALTTYEETRPWARSIARQVEAKQMPPWFATEATHGQFTNERVLSAEEIDTIVGWARTGARRGDPVNAPEPIEWPTGWLIGEPDLVLDLAEPFWVDDDVKDVNISLKAVLITEEMLPEPRWIQAIEFRPGSDVVHHIVGSRVATETETPGASGLLGGIAPGTEPFYLPEGAGRLLMPGTQLYFSMHYNKEPGEGTGVWDRSQMASRQPRLPQPQMGPVGSTVWWPSSPAEPSRPKRSLPSTTTPPPIPVPSANRAIVEIPRPAPNMNSPSVAARTSLSRWTGVFSRAPRLLATGTFRHRVGRFGRNRVMPASRSTHPGQPTATPAGRSPTSRSISSMLSAIRSSTGSQPS